MPILTLVIYLAIIGLIVWLVTTYIPMPAQIKTLIIVVTIVLIVLWIVELTGLIGSGPVVPRLR